MAPGPASPEFAKSCFPGVAIRALLFGPVALVYEAPTIFIGIAVRKRQIPPSSEKIFAAVNLPASHLMSTVNPPLVFKPETEPRFHAPGKAGKTCTSPA